MTKPRSTHQVVSLTLWGVASACLLAASAVDALARDKKTTAAYLAANGDAEINADEPTPAAAGDPSPVVDGSDVA